MRYLRKPKQLTVRKVENAYVVLGMVCTGATVAKLAEQPPVHTTAGNFGVWQFVAGILGAGLLYGLFQLIDKD